VQEAIPARTSDANQRIASGWLYQPSWSGWSRRRDAEAAGGGRVVVEVERGRRGRVARLVGAAAGARDRAGVGPLYSTDVQELIPEVGSDPAHEIRSAWLYQPFASATRPGAMLVTGAVAS
jgi:hypothetical protein